MKIAPNSVNCDCDGTYHHIVMFSSGAGSWGAARRVADTYGTDNMLLLFCDTKGDSDSEHAGEDSDNYRFLLAAVNDIGADLIWLSEGRDVWDVFTDKRFIGNTRVSVCSRVLKQEVARKWLHKYMCPIHTNVYVGIDWTEEHRLENITRNYLPFPVLAPLCHEPLVTKEEILATLTSRGIRPPRLYDMGFAHANCGGFCVRGGHAHFQHLLTEMPDRYAYHEQREEQLRQHLNKDVAILRDRTGGTVRPLTLREFRERIENGHHVDPHDIGGCGCMADDPTELTQEAA